MKQKRLLIIHQQQFGYHSDTYYYCKYLRDSFDISYICWDYNEKRIFLPGINVIYISRRGNLAARNTRFILQVVNELKNNYDFHFIKYFRGCSVLRIVHGKPNFLLDIRSSSVTKKKLNRLVYNLLLTMESRFFKHISIISKSLARKLGFSDKAYILPLGADIISSTKKTFDSMKLLYVGTLYNRNIDHTVKGFSKFYHEYKDRMQIQYTIVGSGFSTEEEELKEIVEFEKTGESVKIAGYIPHDKLKAFFDSHNIGVSYIPKTKYFDVQPPTKSFEYLLSGMLVIATDTLENKAVINNKNGILINDTAEDFYQGLVRVYANMEKYDSSNIRADSMQYTWKKIVDDLSLMLNYLIDRY